MHHRRFTIGAVAALATLALAGTAVAQQPTKAEQAVKYRQSVYQVILWNLGPMAAVIQGRAEHDPARFAEQAERVATMAPMLMEGYPAGSDTGAETRAKAEIWRNMDDFRVLMQNFVRESEQFAQVAETGDLAQIRPAFAEMTQTCKACHDKYRSE